MINSRSVIAAFDISRVDRAGECIWEESALTMHDATARVRELGSSLPGEYRIYSHKTGVEISLEVTQPANLSPWFSIFPEALTVRYRPTR